MGHYNRISKTGLNLIKGFEGLRRRSEALAGGGWIVGYGHTRSAREGVEVSEREAEYLLRYDLQDVEKMVSEAVHAPLNQNEFDALVSFAWNVGRQNFHASDVLKYVNAGEMLAAAESFNAWRKARVDGRLIVVDALVRRRAAEKHMFLSHPSGAPSAPSQIVRPELDVAASVLALSDGALSIETKINEDGTVHKTIREEARDASEANDEFLKAANSNEGRTVALSTTHDEVLTEELVEQEADFFVASEDPEEEPSETEGLSVWDASDADDYDDLDEAELDEDEDEDELDDGLLAAAIAASNLSRVDDEATDAEDDGSDDLTPADTEDAVSEDVPHDVSEDDDAVEEETAEDEAVAEVFQSDESDEDENLTDIVETDDEDDELVSDFADPENGFHDVVDDEDDNTETLLDAYDDEAKSAEISGLTIDTTPDVSEDDTNDDTEDDVGEIWKEDAEETLVVVESEDAPARPKPICIVDPSVADSFPDEMTDQYADEQETFNPVAGGRRGVGELLIGLLPFLILAVLGAAMCVFGIMDWWSVVKSETPVEQSEFYAGPFFTLIGGLGFAFGGYFFLRKLVGVED
ncbi:MAG: hypothetical protein CMK09_16730 [Ponticaulis sp.]|nr:hypothetical protein [Ponticaulis sp.]|tara:strand:+ start:12132 stop:13874 length:1743 start_codon:yes stop_codon:yes gene_type:complete